MRARQVGALAAIVATTVLSSGSALADDRGADWGKTITELDKFVRTGERQTAPAPKKQQERLTLSDDPNLQNMGNAWFGVAPKVTLVARDWSSSTRLAGDKMGFLDNLRLAQSTRMVVGRVRLNSARFTPFVQVGVGQWRVDTRYVPTMAQSVEVAGQLGTGFELRVSRRVQIAAEVSATTLIRYDINNQQPQNVLWSALIASRVQF